jgi:rsbT co-antagonist protein RsbR
MRDRFNAIMTTRATDVDVQRRALAVMQLIAAMLVANVLFLALGLLSSGVQSAFIPIASSICFVGAFVLARQGRASARGVDRSSCLSRWRPDRSRQDTT